jgi:hypothetical protein|tara:strand:- start:61 stop:222 length:162 start_codon:yes stop_codon:yes gene_type:complete
MMAPSKSLASNVERIGFLSPMNHLLLRDKWSERVAGRIILIKNILVKKILLFL